LTDLFDEIDRRLAIGLKYDRWRKRFPWRLMPARLRQRLFGLLSRE
jgi:hypothetical protein